MPSKIFQHLKKSAVLAVIGLCVTTSMLITGCADSPLADPPPKEPANRVFHASYDDVWRAIQLALRKYPVRMNNIESGILETDYVKGDQLFADPVPERSKSGLRYKVLVRAVRGKIDGKRAIKVVITKQSEVQPDFFTGYKTIPSNGLEEDALLYRIGRYLELDKILNNPKNNKPGLFNGQN